MIYSFVLLSVTVVVYCCFCVCAKLLNRSVNWWFICFVSRVLFCVTENYDKQVSSSGSSKERDDLYCKCLMLYLYAM